jgi:hypothetical protein
VPVASCSTGSPLEYLIDLETYPAAMLAMQGQQILETGQVFDLLCSPWPQI